MKKKNIINVLIAALCFTMLMPTTVFAKGTEENMIVVNETAKTSSFEEIKAAYEQALDDYNAAKEAVEAKKKEITDNETSTKNIKNEIDSLNKELEALQKEEKEYSEKVENLKEKLKQDLEDLEKLEELLTQATDALKGARKQMEFAEYYLDCAQYDIMIYGHTEDTDAYLATCEKHMIGATEYLKKTEDNYNKYVKLKNDYNTSITNRQELIAEYEEKIKEIQNDIVDILNRIDEKTEEYNTLLKAKELLEKELKSLEAAAVVAKNKLEEAQKLYDENCVKHITYVLDGGTNDPKNKTEVEIGSGSYMLYDAQKPGYIFDGWFYDPEFILPAVVLFGNVPGDLTIYAKWNPITYDVSFDSNNGTGMTKTVTGLKYGETYDAAAGLFTKNGYYIAAWNTKEDGTGESFPASEIKNATTVNYGAVTLYAVWKKKLLNITYKLNNGTNNDNNRKTFYITTKTFTLNDPSRKGYTFAGWYTDSKCKNRITQIKKGTYEDVTVYAKWTANRYNVKFYANGGSGSMSAKTYKYGTTYVLPANTFRKDGYVFAGWNTKKDGTGTSYSDSASVKSLKYTSGATAKLYAQWKVADYSIKYVLNNGTNNKNNPTSYNVETPTFKLKSPTRTGYTFAGWYTNKSLTKKITSVATGSTGNKTFYAKWTPITYTIWLETDGDASRMDVVYGKSYILDYAEKRTQRFKYWNTKEDGTGTIYYAGKYVKNLCTKNGASITLYAIFEDYDPVEISYVLNGGVNDKNNPTSVMPYKTLRLLDPTKEGYDFAGWYLDPNFKTKVYDGMNILSAQESGFTGTFYAKWKAHEHKYKPIYQYIYHEPVVETVIWIEEPAYDEKVYEQKWVVDEPAWDFPLYEIKYVCSMCDQVCNVADISDREHHLIDCRGSLITKQVIVGYEHYEEKGHYEPDYEHYTIVHHDAVTSEEIEIVKEGYTEKKIIGYECKCGKKK